MIDKNIVRERLLNRIIHSTSGCWEWTGCSRGNGYGCMKVGSKLIDTHRLSFLVFKGAIPDGLLVCHTCDNKKCINPDHLFTGTHQDNYDDSIKKGRASAHSLENRLKIREHGRRVALAYILGNNSTLISNIRADLMLDISGADIGRKYGVSKFVVSRIKNNKAWQWIV